MSSGLPNALCLQALHWSDPANAVETRDDDSVQIAKAFVQQTQFFAAVAEVVSALPSPIVSVTPSLGTDWNGEPAVFFEIVLEDGTPRGQLLNLTKKISHTIVQQVQPLEEWHVLPYFNFYTQSERARVNELARA
jgi:hypothetical protein